MAMVMQFCTIFLFNFLRMTAKTEEEDRLLITALCSQRVNTTLDNNYIVLFWKTFKPYF